MKTMKTVIGCALICLVNRAAFGETLTFLPETSTYVDSAAAERDKPHLGIIACSRREGVMRLDVGGMENVTNATLRLFVTQHNASDSKAVILRKLHDADWLESQVTLTALAHEFPTMLTPWTSKDDPSVIGYCPHVPAQGEWAEFDITEAVKSEASRSGKLAFAVSAMGFNGSIALCFGAVTRDDPAEFPQFVVSWADGESRGALRPWVKCDLSDEFTAENNGATIRIDNTFLAGGGREAFFKFDLSGLVGGGAVRRAVLKFAPRDFANAASSRVYVHSYDNVAWTEADYPAGSRQGNLPNGKTTITTSAEGAVRFGGTWSKTAHNEGDVTELVRAALAAGRDKLTLGLIVLENYAIGASRREGVKQPAQLWVDMTPSADAPPATPAWAKHPRASRTAIHYARINNFSNKDASGNSANEDETVTSIQTGSSNQNTTKRVSDGFLLFDPSGLANAPYVRLRLKISQTTNHSGSRRIFARATPFWNCAKMTWNNMITEFDRSRVDELAAGNTNYPNHVALIEHNIGSGTSHCPYLEADVTEVVREAARTGQHVTFMLGATHNTGWTWYCNEKHENEAYRPKLVYPEIRGFAGDLRATTEPAADGHLAAAISWTPSDAPDATYTITRLDLAKNVLETLATNIAEPHFTDDEARSDRAYVYSVTAVTPDGETSTAQLTNRIDNTVSIMNVLDGYVQNGGNKSNPANWKARTIVLKDGDGGASDSGVTREGFVRFPLGEVPADAIGVKLRLRTTASHSEVSGNEVVYFRTVPDCGKSDEDPPTWSDLMGTAVGATGVDADGVFHTVAFGSSPLPTSAEIDVDVTELIRAAKGNGETHILFHLFIRDPDCRANIGFCSKDSPYDTSAPRLVCERKSWVPGGMVIILR